MFFKINRKSLVNKERESSIQGRKILNNLEFGIVQGKKLIV